MLRRILKMRARLHCDAKRVSITPIGQRRDHGRALHIEREPAGQPRHPLGSLNAERRARGIKFRSDCVIRPPGKPLGPDSELRFQTILPVPRLSKKKKAQGRRDIGQSAQGIRAHSVRVIENHRHAKILPIQLGRRRTKHVHPATFRQQRAAQSLCPSPEKTCRKFARKAIRDRGGRHVADVIIGNGLRTVQRGLGSPGRLSSAGKSRQQA